MNAIALFYRPTCGYCQKVLSFLRQSNIDIPLRNTSESSQICDELIAIAGKTQVPCLVIDGKPLHESDDIIEWFKTHWR